MMFWLTLIQPGRVQTVGPFPTVFSAETHGRRQVARGEAVRFQVTMQVAA